MIDPEKVTNYRQTDRQLEEFILFWVCAAGKNGRTAARCLDKFLDKITYSKMTPFQAIRNKCSNDNFPEDMIPDGYKYMPEIMRDCGIGCYGSKSRTLTELAFSNINLRTCTVSDLESIHGVGPKTARCFLLHSRENAQVAGLDTHMLKHLRALGYDDVPKSTPTEKKYLTNEKRVLSLAKEAGMTPAEFDLWVWNKYSIKSEPGA